MENATEHDVRSLYIPMPMNLERALSDLFHIIITEPCDDRADELRQIIAAFQLPILRTVIETQSTPNDFHSAQLVMIGGVWMVQIIGSPNDSHVQPTDTSQSEIRAPRSGNETFR